MEHSVLIFTIWRIEWWEVDLPISFHWCRFVLRYITEWSIYKLALSMPKTSVCDIFFYLLEIWNKCACVVWLVGDRWCLATVFGELLFRRVTAQPRQGLALCGTSTCATVVSGIWVMTLLLVLVSKLRVWPLLLENSNLVITWGLLRHLSVFLADLLSRSQAVSLP